MKKQFFIANWKSNKTLAEAKSWLEESQMHLLQTALNEKIIILCPPFPLLPFCKEYITQHRLPIQLGSQTTSSFPEGTYTGEVSSRLLRDFVTYTLIGHSERRKFFHEDQQNIKAQVSLSLASAITPILLIGDKDEEIPPGVSIVIYEPPSAISTSSKANPENPEEIERIALFIKQKNTVSYVLYGGSVGPTNTQDYVDLPSIDGVIVGRESLDPRAFAEIVHHA